MEIPIFTRLSHLVTFFFVIIAIIVAGCENNNGGGASRHAFAQPVARATAATEIPYIILNGQ